MKKNSVLFNCVLGLPSGGLFFNISQNNQKIKGFIKNFDFSFFAGAVVPAFFVWCVS